MRPRLRLAYLNETDDWAPEVVEAAGRVAGVYVYDTTQRVHCCEWTASYALYLAGALSERHVGDGVQAAMGFVTEVGQVRYVHCWQVDALRRARRRPRYMDIDPFAAGTASCTAALPGPWPRDHDAAIEEALEVLTTRGYTTT